MKLYFKNVFSDNNSSIHGIPPSPYFVANFKYEITEIITFVFKFQYFEYFSILFCIIKLFFMNYEVIYLNKINHYNKIFYYVYFHEKKPKNDKKEDETGQ